MGLRSVSSKSGMGKLRLGPHKLPRSLTGTRNVFFEMCISIFFVSNIVFGIFTDTSDPREPDHN